MAEARCSEDLQRTKYKKIKDTVKVETMTTKTLNNLSSEELEEFKSLNEPEKGFQSISRSRLKEANTKDLVELMEQTYSQDCVEMTKKVLKKMNRTDLVQRLTDISSGTKELFLDRHRAELIQRVKNISPILDGLLSNNVINEDIYGVIKAIPDSQEKMTALFSGPLESSGVQGKQIFYKILNDNEPRLIEDLQRTEYKKVMDKVKVATMTTKEALLKTLNNLSSEELEEFKSLIEPEKGFPSISRSRLKEAKTKDQVELMEQRYSQDCVETNKKVLKKMNRTDLVQRLTDISSGTKEKNTEKRPALIQRVKTMASVVELLLGTLAHLSDEELKKFKVILHQNYLNIPLVLQETTDMPDTVFFLVETYGQQSVEKIKKVLKMMKRTDLVQKLSNSSPGAKQKQSVDEHLSALIHKMATMVSVKELLVETLKDLSNEDLKRFKWLLQLTFFQRSLPNISWRRLQTTHTAHLLADLMVEECGKQSVEMTREVLMDMNRTDLVQRLSESSSGSKAAGSSAEVFVVNTTEGEKQSVDEHWPALIQEVETMASVIELLLDTLADLSEEELKKFKRELKKFKMELRGQTYFFRHFSDIPLMLLETKDMQDSVFFLVLNYGQQSVEKTKEVLKKMKRTDLVQRLSDRSSGPKKKQSADEHRSALIHKVSTKAAVEQLLLETLNYLSNEEFEQFKEFLQVIVPKKDLPAIFKMLSDSAGRSDEVDLMMQTYGQQSVEVTKEVLEKINRTDLVQRLSKSSSEKHQPELLERVPEMEAVERVLSETLNDLSYEEHEKFKWLLHFTYFQKSLPQIPWSRLKWANRADELVDLMVKSHGQQSVEVTREVFTDMNRTDLVERLSESSSRLKEKNPSEVFQKDVTMTSPQEKLLETLKVFSYGELEQFKCLLQQTEMEKGLPTIPVHRMEMADRVEMVELMVEIYGQQSEEMTREVLKTMNRNDLVQRLSDISSGSKGPSRGLELEGCGSITQDSSDWTKLEPEFSTDADESPTYSLQSEAGKFECTVSGLRWFCKEKVSFKYQFGSWKKHVERMESLKYMPAGPLVDITAIDGKLFEVYLPHWICIDDIPEIMDKFAVLHVEDCGDVVEKVSEVTPSHVKLSEPTFSLRGILLSLIYRFVKIKPNVLIYYKPNTPFLKLHVYLIPHDPALQQTLNKTELSKGYKIIQKPRPDEYLRKQNGFHLTADIETAKVQPKKITLRHEEDPNFYEVYVENPDRNFYLTLHPYTNEGEPPREPVWICEIQKDDYQNSVHLEAARPSTGASGVAGGRCTDKHFVDKHQVELIQRVNNIGPILDKVFLEQVIQGESYDKIRKLSTPQEKMRELYKYLNAGRACKDIFYDLLKKHEPFLVADLN